MLRPLTEPAVKIAALALVPPDVLVDRLVAHAQPAHESEQSADLFRAEISAQQLCDQSPVIGSEVALPT